MTYRALISFILYSTFLIIYAANDIPWPEKDIWPESPQAKAIRQVMMPTPAIATGACEFSVPLYTIDVEGFKLPLSLQYRSNGIKPEDDPQPIGYGWVLTPPMRISRQIMGRPDELFKFVGEIGSDFVFEDNLKGFYSVTMLGASDRKYHHDLYDTEYDIYTVYLIDKTLTMVYKDGTLKGLDCDEYKVECGERFSYIKVTDPKGNIYNFSVLGECIDLDSMCVEWQLSSITLQSGTVINFDWSLFSHTAHGLNMLAPTSLYYQTGENSFTYVNEPGRGGYGRLHKYLYTQNLKSISFPGGKVQCNYEEFSNVKMLDNIVVSNEDKPIIEISLERTGDFKLLSSLRVQDETYTFEYDPQKFSRADMIDWWGFYNGKDNKYNMSPTVTPTKGIHGNLPISGADRSVDESKMKAYILTKVTYPIGGTVEWDYEIHKFPQQTAPSWIGLYLSNEVSFSKGGGLRIKSIRMKENPNDPNPRIKNYIYGVDGDGNAEISAVPFLHTFITDTHYLSYRFSCQYQENYQSTDHYMVINRFSDFMAYQIGTWPIWYRKVTEIDSEGKTEYIFDKICPDNIVDRDWGMLWPSEINEAFSTGPVQKACIKYKSTPNGYTPVEKYEMDYALIENENFSELNSFKVNRSLLYLYDSEYYPDFGPDEGHLEGLMTWQFELDVAPPDLAVRLTYFQRDNYSWFEGFDYTINPRRERLTAKTITKYHDNGEIRITEKYEYVPNTDLLSKTVVSNSQDSIIRNYSYADAYSSSISSEMKNRNIVGMLTGVEEKYNGSPSSYSMELGRFGTVFCPVRIWQYRNQEEWNNGTYDYTSKGFILKHTSKSGLVKEWTWDSFGNPLSVSINSSLTSNAEWCNLVGVTSMTQPFGQKQFFNYDNYGRLESAGLNSRILQKYEYNITQTGESYIKVKNHAGPDNGLEQYSHFDGLGRKWADLSRLPDGTETVTLTEFDVMGRPFRQWAPVWKDSEMSSDEIKAAAEAIYSDSHPYSVVNYEPSQRELELSTVKAGELWHTADKKSLKKHAVNDLSAYKCPKYTATSTGVVANGYYTKGLLSVEISTDEDGRSVELYKDLRDLVICRKESGLTTSYVYNDYGDLAYILPPGLSGTHLRSDAAMTSLAYWYDYDGRGRLIRKKIPGAKTASYVYDEADRLVAEQSPHHTDDTWRFYGYDHADRLVLAVDCPASAAQAADFAATCRTAVLSATGKFKGYQLSDVPEEESVVVWAKYYDDYRFITCNSLGDEFRWVSPSDIPSYNTYSPSSLGLLTGIYTGKGFESYHYNTDGRLMQRYSTGFNRGWKNIFYGYDGQPIRTESVYPDDGLPALTFSFSYDEAGRVINQTVTQGDQLTGHTATISTSYNLLGQISDRTLGEATRSFTYDIHGWLKSSQTNVGAQERSETLFYADSATPCYNGNISARQFSSGRYDYTYDNYNCLTSAMFSKGLNGADFSTAYIYDERGNITSLIRTGVIDKAGTNETFGCLDNLNMTYSGNKLTRVDAVTEALPFSGMTGIGRNSTDLSLGYDSSGRLCRDETRNIDLIEYDNDGHPVHIVFSNGAEHRFEWDGMGNRIAWDCYLRGYQGGRIPYVCKRYCGDGQFEYYIENNVSTTVLAYTSFPGGFFDASGTQYYISDYQGNNICYIDSVPKIKRETGYYPYGEPWREINGIPLMFCGNERLLDDGLNEYDFHARRYRAAVPAFSSWDQYNEKYPWLSPYAYAAGNPVNLIDPDGNRVRPNGDKELDMIKNTLPYNVRSSVFTDQLGFIDANAVNSIKSDDINVEALKRLVNDFITIDVILSDQFEFTTQLGVKGLQNMSYHPFEKGYSIEKDIFGITPGGTSTGEEGFLGKTLFPDRVGIQNSTDNNIKIIVHKALTPNGAAEVYSHEANGHALLYIDSFYNHYAASHQYVGNFDVNQRLIKMITDSKKATIKNMAQ